MFDPPVWSAATPSGPRRCSLGFGCTGSPARLCPSAPVSPAVPLGGGLHAGCLTKASWETGSQTDRWCNSWPWSLQGQRQAHQETRTLKNCDNDLFKCSSKINAKALDKHI